MQVLRRSSRRCRVPARESLRRCDGREGVQEKERISMFRAASRRLESSRRLITFVVACCISLPWLQHGFFSGRVSNGIYRKQDRRNRWPRFQLLTTLTSPESSMRDFCHVGYFYFYFFFIIC